MSSVVIGIFHRSVHRIIHNYCRKRELLAKKSQQRARDGNMTAPAQLRRVKASLSLHHFGSSGVTAVLSVTGNAVRLGFRRCIGSAAPEVSPSHSTATRQQHGGPRNGWRRSIKVRAAAFAITVSDDRAEINEAGKDGKLCRLLC
jgi:hypothetical protein